MCTNSDPWRCRGKDWWKHCNSDWTPSRRARRSTAIEARTGEKWDRIVEEQEGKASIVGMVKNLLVQGKRVVVNVNNHYEGSAPLTIERIREMLDEL